jgi:hypothetical protein
MIRQRLHNFLEVANAKKIRAIYTMLETDIQESSLDFTPTIKADLDNRLAAIKTGKTKKISKRSSRERINKLLAV